MATMQDVADRAQVSIATVSFVLNGTKPVAPKTRERIMAAIADLGYHPNAMARALARRRSRVVALIYPLFDHRNHHAFIDGAVAAAAENGYSLVLWPVHSDNATAEISALIQAGIADGVLLMEVLLDDERVEHLQAVGAPFALIGRTRDTTGIDYVDIDFERSIEVVVADLAALGHRRFCLIIEDLSGTPMACYGPPVRAEQSFRETLAARGLEGTVIPVAHDPQGILDLADQIESNPHRPTAVLAMHDEAVFSLMSGLRHRGIRIPQDISVAAVAASVSLARLTDPPLTAYDAPGEALGRRATEALIARIDGTATQSTQLRIACTLAGGASVGPAPVD